MMIARTEHKKHARKILKKQKSGMIGADVVSSLLVNGSRVAGALAIGLAVVLAVLLGAYLLFGNLLFGNSNWNSLLSSLSLLLRNPVLVILIAAALVLGVVLIGIRIVNVVWKPFSAAADCGMKRYYLSCAADDAPIRGLTEVFDGFQDYSGAFCTYLLLYLLLLAAAAPFVLVGYLCGLLEGMAGLVLKLIFFILAPVSSYVVSRFCWAVPYVKAEQPGRGAVSCLKEGRKVSRGHELDFFLLDLSFLGWALLSVISLGLVGLFYYKPYRRMTNALVYRELRGDRFVVDDCLNTIPGAASSAVIRNETAGGKAERRKQEGVADAAAHKAQTGSQTGGILGLSGEYVGVAFDLKIGQSVTLGRDAGRCNIVLKNAPKVSGRHCEIRYVGGRYEITDYSSNGTVVDGRKIPKEVPVSFDAGARVDLADETVSFRLK